MSRQAAFQHVAPRRQAGRRSIVPGAHAWLPVRHPPSLSVHALSFREEPAGFYSSIQRALRMPGEESLFDVTSGAFKSKRDPSSTLRARQKRANGKIARHSARDDVPHCFVGARYIVPGAHAWLPVRDPPRISRSAAILAAFFPRGNRNANTPAGSRRYQSIPSRRHPERSPALFLFARFCAARDAVEGPLLD